MVKYYIYRIALLELKPILDLSACGHAQADLIGDSKKGGEK